MTRRLERSRPPTIGRCAPAPSRGSRPFPSRARSSRRGAVDVYTHLDESSTLAGAASPAWSSSSGTLFRRWEQTSPGGRHGELITATGPIVGMVVSVDAVRRTL